MMGEAARACAALETLLNGPLRASVVDAAARQPTMARALAYLVERMRAHAWRAGEIEIALGDVIDGLDRATRLEGFHVLHDWNGKADAVTANTIAIDAVEFASGLIGDRPAGREALALALDYYFLYLLALVAMRSWDDGEPGANLDRVTRLLQHCRVHSAAVSVSPTTRRRFFSSRHLTSNPMSPATTCCSRAHASCPHPIALQWR
jgi:hypothetical protein